MAEHAPGTIAEGFLAASTEGAAVLVREAGGDRWVHDRVNGPYADLVGADDPATLSGVPLRNHVDEADRDRVRAALQGVAEASRPDPGAADDAWEWAVSLRTAGGERVEVTLSAAPAGDRVVVTVREVGRSDHAVVEAAIDGIDDVFFVVDEDGDYVRYNDAIERSLGWTDREVDGRDPSSFIAGNRDPDCWEDLADDEPVVVDLLDVDGNRVPYEYRGWTVTDENGDRYRVGVGRQMAEREERERLLASLHEATDAIQRATTDQEVYRWAVEAATEILDWPVVGCWRHDRAAAELVPVAGHEATRRRFGEGDEEWEIFREGDPGVLELGDRPDIDEGTVGVLFPLGDHGALGAAAPEAEEYADEAFDTLAILAAHVETALARIEREREFRRSKERYRTLVENAPVPIVILDGDATIRYCNAATADYLDADSPGELIGEDGGSFVHPEDRGPAVETVRRTVEQDKVAPPAELRFGDEGDRVAVAAVAPVVFEGEPAAQVVVNDVTDRKEREHLLAALHETTDVIQRARTPQEACRRGVEAAHEILGWDHTACWLHDPERGALVPATGHNAGDLEFAEGDPEWEIFRAGEPDTIDVNEAHPDTESDIGRAMMFPLGDHGVIGAADPGADEYADEDFDTLAILAAHVETALDRIEREREVRRERDRFTTLFESIPEPVVHAEFDGDDPIVRNVNSAFERTFGHDAEEVVGEDIDEYVVPEDTEAQEGAREINRLGRNLSEIDREVRRLAADGERDFLFRSLPFDDEAEPVESIGIYVDITERKERERERQRQRDELATLNRINELLLNTTRVLSDAPSRSDVEETVCERLADSDFYRFAWIGERDVDGERVVPRASAGEGEGFLDDLADDGVVPGKGPGGRALRSGEVQVVEDVAEVPEFEPWRSAAEERGFRSAAAVPLVHGDAVYGLLVVYADSPAAFSEREQDGFRTLGETVGFVLNAIGNRKLLVADTVTELEFTVESHDAFLAKASAELDCTVALDGYTVHEDENSLLYVSVEGASPAALAGMIDRFEGLADARVLSETENGGRVELDSTGRSSIRTALDAGAAVTEAVATNGTTHLTVEVPQSVDARGVVDRIASLLDRAELVATRDLDRPVRTAADLRESLEERLTERRLMALRTAYLSGYFEWPREATAEEVADSMGITSATLHNHLRKSQKELMSVVFDAGPVGSDRA
ncbi:hypothetical protein BRD00_08835 [Halobacteriales archaeon QS_8_69_26]|nr:MAG: hypothetical protein BRD00_08835 [Halobacteriales archaeon QS_8_69_26]